MCLLQTGKNTPSRQGNTAAAAMLNASVPHLELSFQRLAKLRHKGSSTIHT
jgi:hypothetical protein